MSLLVGKYSYPVFIFMLLTSSIIMQSARTNYALMLLLVAVAWLLYVNSRSHNKQISLPKGHLWLLIIVFFAWCALSTLWSYQPYYSFSQFLWLCFLVVGVLSYFVLGSVDLRWQHTWSAVVCVGVVLSVLSGIQLLQGNTYHSSFFINKNTHAALLTLILLPTVGSYLLSRIKKNTVVLGVVVAVLIFGSTLPLSRGALLGQYFSLFILLVVAWKSVSIKRIGSLLLIYISAVVITRLVSSSSTASESIASAAVSGSARWDIWMNSLRLLNDMPWYGSGLGTYRVLFAPYRSYIDDTFGFHPHNDYLHFLIEIGVPGLLLFLAIILVMFYQWFSVLTAKTDRNKVLEITAVGVGVTVVLIHAFFAKIFGVVPILFIVGLLLARFIELSGAVRLIDCQDRAFKPGSYQRLIAWPVLIIFSLFCMSVTLSSHIVGKINEQYEKGNITSVENYLFFLKKVEPFTERSYWLNAQFYERILSLETKLTDAQKVEIFKLALQNLEEAEAINPLRPIIFFIRGNLFESNAKHLAFDALQLAVDNYKKALEVDPYYKTARTALIRLLNSMGELEAAVRVSDEGIKYRYPADLATLELYQAVLDVYKDAKNKAALLYVTALKDAVIQNLRRQGVDVSPAN